MQGKMRRGSGMEAGQRVSQDRDTTTITYGLKLRTRVLCHPSAYASYANLEEAKTITIPFFVCTVLHCFLGNLQVAGCKPPSFRPRSLNFTFGV